MNLQLLGVHFAALVFVCSSSSAAVISCPPSPAQEELNPKATQICFAIQQAIQDSAPQSEAYTGRLFEERNTNLNSKRQDVDHVFLRFGRRFGF